MTDIRRPFARGLGQLDALYGEAIRAYAPPNPQFERDRIIASLTNKRELAYVCGFLSEGENEAALIIELMSEVLDVDPDADVAHLADEAWYYLRTSIDVTWQLEPNPAPIGTALEYLIVVITRRIARVSASFQTALADTVETDARTLMSTGGR